VEQSKSEGWCLDFAVRYARFAKPEIKPEIRKRNADRRNQHCAVPLARPRIQRDAHACRRSTTALAKGTFVAQGSASGQSSWDAARALDP
jgi:hypothetical protein